MIWYFAFMGMALVQWFLLYPKGKVPIGIEVASRHNLKFAVIICLELILFAGLRDVSIGADTGVYLRALNYYESLPKGSILGAELVYPFDFEIGYFMLTKLCAFLRMSDTQFLLLIAVIIYIPLFAFFYKYSENLMLSFTAWFTLGLFVYSLGLFRQMIAISIILCGFSYIKERRLIRYLLVVILASTFHATALISIPLYFLFSVDIKKSLFWVLIIEGICYIGAREILLLILQFVPQYSGFIGGIYDLQGQGNIMLIILNILLVFGHYVYLKSEKAKDPTMHICINAMMLAAVLQAFAHAMAIFGRLTNYYSIYMVLLIPMCINRYFDQKSRVYANIIVFLLMMVFYINSMMGGALEPYQFNWGDQL